MSLRGSVFVLQGYLPTKYSEVSKRLTDAGGRVTSTLSSSALRSCAVDIQAGPVVNQVIPDHGSSFGGYDVVIIGTGFAASHKFRVRIGDLVAKSFDFHSPTAVVCHLPHGVPARKPHALLQASNDAGRTWGKPIPFTFTFEPMAGPTDENLAVMATQFRNLQRSIQELQDGVTHVLRTERFLAGHLSQLGVDIPASLAASTDGSLGLGRSSDRVPGGYGANTYGGYGYADRPEAADRPVHAQPQRLQQAALSNDREIVIFISSTFRDMKTERDLLVKKVFPQVRKLCSSRDVNFSYVDLRWGLTGNQQIAALSVCLREISQSNIFVSFLGERYGWCRSASTDFLNVNAEDEALKRAFEMASGEFPFVSQYTDRSITEIEVRAVIENRLKRSPAAFFYLRDPYYLEELPADKRSDFEAESDMHKAKLEAFKKELRASSYPIHDYARPEKVVDVLKTDLLRLIESQYPEGSQLSPLQSERFRHSTFAKSLTKTYLHQEYDSQLDKYVQSNEEKPLVILGPPGSGKSALLANWVAAHKSHHPEDIVITHFIGATPKSTEFYEILVRVIREVCDLSHQDAGNIPSTPEGIIEEFPLWMDRILKKVPERIIICLDALESVDERENARELTWLPYTFPSRFRVFLSSAPGRTADVCRMRQYEVLEMKDLRQPDRVTFIRKYLDTHSKRLSDAQENNLASAPQTGNARYLRVLLDDLIAEGDFEGLDARIRSNLSADNTAKLYSMILQRISREWDKQTIKNRKLSGLVAHVLSLIWASRHGLSQDELKGIFEAKDLSEDDWAEAFVLVEEFLLSSSGLFIIANQELRAAVQQTFLSNHSDKLKRHAQLAAYFQTIEANTERKVLELPWHLERGEMWVDLGKCLLNLNMFVRLYTPLSKADLFRYWRAVEEHTGQDPSKEYQATLQVGRQGYFLPSDMSTGDVFYNVGFFLEEFARFDGAEACYKKAMQHYQNASQPLEVARIHYCLARCYMPLALHEEADAQLKEALAIYTSQKGPDDVEVANVLNRLGALYTEQDKLVEAESAFARSLKIRQDKLGPTNSRVGQTLKNMMNLYDKLEKRDMALKMGLKALEITEKKFGGESMITNGIVVRLGALCTNMGKFAEAKEWLDRGLRVSQKIYGPKHPLTADVIYLIGSLYFVQSLYPDAETYFTQARDLVQENFGDNHPDYARVVNRLATLYVESTRFPEAEGAFKIALKIREERLGPNHSRVGQTLKNMLTLYELQENFDEAYKVGLRALKITEETLGPEHIAVSSILMRLGGLSFEMGEEARGRELLDKCIAIREKRYGSDSRQVKEARTLLNELNNPKPVVKVPPPPPMPTLLVPELYVMPTKEQLKADNRNALLAQIQATNKEKVIKKKTTTEKKVDHAGWWKQNYNVGAHQKKFVPKPSPGGYYANNNDDDDIFAGNIQAKPPAKPTLVSSKPAPPPPPPMPT